MTGGQVEKKPLKRYRGTHQGSKGRESRPVIQQKVPRGALSRLCGDLEAGETQGGWTSDSASGRPRLAMLEHGSSLVNTNSAACTHPSSSSPLLFARPQAAKGGLLGSDSHRLLWAPSRQPHPVPTRGTLKRTCWWRHPHAGNLATPPPPFPLSLRTKAKLFNLQGHWLAFRFSPV